MSRLMMPAVTLAGALALAACGGGSGGTPAPTGVACDDGSRAASAEACAQREADAALVTAANGAVTDVMKEANALDVTADGAADDVKAAEGSLADAKAAIAALPDGAADLAADLTANLVPVENLIKLARAYVDADAADETERKRLQGLLDTAQGKVDEAAEAMRKAEAAKRTADAKALMKALTDGDGSTSDNTTAFGLESLDIEGNASDSPPAITLKKDSSATVAALGDWKGTKYTGKQGEDDDAQSAEAVSYSNQEPGDPISFSQFAVGDGGLSNAPNAQGVHEITESSTGKNVGGDAFPTRGRETYEGNERKFTGTYNGASGTYECTGAVGSCTARFRGEEGILLAGDWTFKPAAGATVGSDGANYQYFGWWVRKNSDGEPTNVAAFYRHGGTAPIESADNLIDGNTNPTAVIGAATYTGKAAGKYAIANPLDAANDGSGHFTANAFLEADFKTAESTLKGTIDAFRLNDGTADPGWTVSLKEAEFDTTSNRWSVSEKGTEWQIGTAKGGAAGEWEAAMFPAKTGSDNNTPSAVAGSFHSAIGSSHRMRGAFGAELD